MPTYSVIVVTYNRLEYLKQALESVYRQTFRDFEIIVADGGSDDGSLEYLNAENCSTPLRVISLKHNPGPATLINQALDSATGSLAAILEADDYWAPDYLIKMRGVFNDTRTHFARCNYEVINDVGEAIGSVDCRAEDDKNPMSAALKGR
ncbi:MAG: glycosyltransferase family 2 protein [Elusimicrobiota bacterium]